MFLYINKVSFFSSYISTHCTSSIFENMKTFWSTKHENVIMLLIVKYTSRNTFLKHQTVNKKNTLFINHHLYIYM